MIIDEKGKLFGKISIIDFLVILVLIVAIAGAGYKVLGDKGTSVVVPSDEFTVVMRIDGVKEFVPEAIKEGEVVIEQHADVIGVVTDVRTEPYRGIIAEGGSEMIVYEDRVNVFVTLDCVGFVKSDGSIFTQGNKQLFKGGAITLQSRYFEAGAFVDSMEAK